MITNQTEQQRVQGHYKVQEIPYGKVYKWVPGQQTIEGKPHLLREDTAYLPEQRAYHEWLREEEAHPALKHYEWLELQGLFA
jgi:hypothetical protein